MSVLNKLAISLGRRDEAPNIELAKHIAGKNDKNAVRELVETLSNTNKAIRHDCIKTLYETGYLNPSLISDYSKQFIEQLDSKNNRMQWGAMTALSSIAKKETKELFKALPKIIDVVDKGSVITKDHCYKIMCGLSADKTLAPKVFPLMMEHLLKSPANQLPKYAEETLPFVTDKNQGVLLRTLKKRLEDAGAPAKKARLEKVIKKLEKN